MRRDSLIVALLVCVLSALVSAPIANAAFPGTNGRVAWNSNRDGDFEIFSMNADFTFRCR